LKIPGQCAQADFQCLGSPGKSGSGGRFGPESRVSRDSGAENPGYPVFFIVRPPARRWGAPTPAPNRPGGRRATGGGGYRAAAAAAPAPRHHGGHDRRGRRGHRGHHRGARGRCRRPPPRAGARRARGCRPPTAGSAAGAAATMPAAVAPPLTSRARVCRAWHVARGCAREKNTGRWPATRRTAGRRTDFGATD